MSDNKIPASAQLVVIGAGPGGYHAAFKAAELGLDVTVIDPEANPGGVCLHRGCIPSKALLHVAKVVEEAAESADIGVTFAKPKIDVDRVRAWKNEVVGKLTGGLEQLAKQRKVRVIQGTAKFESAHRLRLDNDETIDFEQCIIAAGSEPIMLPDLPEPVSRRSRRRPTGEQVSVRSDTSQDVLGGEP
mgnify:CR=1 FL=1